MSGSGARALRARKILVLIAKIAATLLCFWYLAHNVDLDEFAAAARSLQLGWAAAACLVMMLQIPLVGVRWAHIIDQLEGASVPIPRGPVVAIAAVSTFFSQVLPNLVGDSMRVFLLTRLGRSWRLGLVRVVIDRGVGVATLLGIAFLTLLLPSAITAFGDYREVAIGVFAAALVAAGAGLLAAHRVGSLLELYRPTRLLGKFAHATHDVLLGAWMGLDIVALAVLVHVLTIVTVWLLGLALGMDLPMLDAAVLFTVMVGAAVLPISVGGWGVREVAVVALLRAHGMPVEQALFFSVLFGLVLIVASLPGAIVWAGFSPSLADPSRA